MEPSSAVLANLTAYLATLLLDGFTKGIKTQHENTTEQTLLEAKARRSREPAASHRKSNQKTIEKTIPA